mgnify:FL=1
MFLGFSTFFPIFFILIPRHKIDSGFYNFNLGLSGIVASFALMLLWIANIEMSVLIYVFGWLAVHLIITSIYWNSESISFIPLLVSSLLGLVVFWIIFIHFHPELASPRSGFITLIGNGILSGVFFAMILGHWYLNVIRLPIRLLRNVTIVLFILVGIRVGIDLYGLITQTVLTPIGTPIPLYIFVTTFGGFFISLALFFGLIVPVIVLAMVWKTIQIQSTQSATGLLYVSCVSVLFGDLFYRYCLMQYGLVL